MKLTPRQVMGLLIVLVGLYWLWQAVGELQAAEQTPAKADRLKADVERGRYLVIVGACNDCHTMGFAEAAGKMPEGEWLSGSKIGFRGPWGTSYPANLRLVAQQMTEDQWVARATSPLAPPMPWYALRDMKQADVRAMYRYIRSLGPKGEAVPALVPPGQQPATPYFSMEPQNLPKK